MNFIDNYRTYAASLTDCPENFHEVMGLAVIGAALGNRVWFEGGASRSYPNLYVLILGPSGCGKSYALKIAADFTDHLEIVDGTGAKRSLVPRYPNQFSSESLVDTLQDDPSGVFIVSELSAIMKLFSKSYMAGAQAMITDIYDGAGTIVVRTKKEGTRKISGENLAPSFWAASTLEWFQKRLTMDDIMGGWWNRFLLVRGVPEKFYPVQPLGDKVKRGELLDALVEIARLKGEADDRDAQKAYIEWIGDTQKRWPQGGMWGNFPRRLHLMVRKLALCLEAGRTCSLKVSPESIVEAAELVDRIFGGLLAMEADELTFSRDEYSTKVVRDIIKQAGAIQKTTLARQSRMMSAQLDVILKTLWDRQEITEDHAQDARGEWHTIYRWARAEAKNVDMAVNLVVPTVTTGKGNAKCRK